jgi:hypothetical protein
MMIERHTELAAARGDVWETRMCGVAGGRLQQYVDGLFPAFPHLEPMPEDEKWLSARRAIENPEEKWDVVVLQPHQAHLEFFARWLDREAGDISSGGVLIEWIARNQPQARIYLYQAWTTPRYDDGNQENPDWESFDYESYWLRPYSNPAPEDDPFPSRVMRTQDYHSRLRQILSEKHAEILGGKPIPVIPVGDALLELERRLKAGTFVDSDGKPFVLSKRTVLVDNEKDRNFAGIREERIPFRNVNVFYQDFQHQNTGLPRYFHSAVFYATLFGSKPVGLDYSAYNVFPRQREDGSYDMTSNVIWRPNDNRMFIEVTPELADAVGELIWDVVSNHPHTGLSGG